MTTAEKKLRMTPEVVSARKPWEPPRLTYCGHVAEIVRHGGGKLTPAGGDPGDARKQSGGG